MKKLLLSFALLILGYGGFAQSGGLTVINHNPVCDVWVDVYAGDLTLPIPAIPGTIRASLVVPAGGGTLTFANPALLYPFATNITGFSLAQLIADLASPSCGWAWTDVEFQYSCPDCGIGGRMSANSPISCTAWPGNYYSGLGPVWGALTCNPPASFATWTPFSNCVLQDVTLDFY